MMDKLLVLRVGLSKRMREGQPPHVPASLYPDLLLGVSELAGFWHLPHEEFTAAKISWAKKQVPIPSEMVGKTEGVCLGTNQYGGRVEQVYMRHENRVSHLYVVGRTRMGKSNFLHRLIDQDIEQGYGVWVVDPHGQLVQDILRWSIPQGREEEVVVLERA